MNKQLYLNIFKKLKLLVVAVLMISSLGLFANNHPVGFVPGLPGIICPNDIVQNNDPGQCSAIVTFVPPAASSLDSGLPSGSTFPVGTTINTYNQGDTLFCSFSITVVDAELPEISCPEDIIKSYDDGICQSVTFEQPTATDNCGVISLVQTAGLSSGSVFPIGTNLVTFEATDAAGNASSCTFTITINGGHSTVLLTDGSSTQEFSPQGSLRYQRFFYLVKPEEMAESGFETGMDVNSLGFTIVAAQDDTTKGHLKVYLQNTDNTISRIDTNWSTATTANNSYPLVGIDQGLYEWKVKATCSGTSEYSQTNSFSNDDLDGCNQVYNLETLDITDVSATFAWDLVASASIDSLLLEYSIFPDGTWESVYTTNTIYMATGLTPGSNYQWRLTSLCSGENSPLSAISFSTDNIDVCNEPSGLTLISKTGSTAQVSWAAAGGASHYSISIRRFGTTSWTNAFSFSNSYTFSDLWAGTTYEWKLKTVCSSGSGAFVNGSNITTNGSAPCYPPEGLKATGISNSGATLTWLPVSGATSYEVKYRLKESISWANAINPMTLASDGPITIPDETGPYDVPFVSGSQFTYNGEGVYIAWEYSRPAGPLSSPNTALSTEQNTTVSGVNGLDSLRYILSFNGKTSAGSTGLPTTLRATYQRPETKLGSPSLQDSLEVTAVYTLGNVAIPYSSPVAISALVKNFSDVSITVPVTLNIIDQGSNTLRHNEVINQVIPASCGELVIFTDWMPAEFGTDSIIVSVPELPGENVLENNRNYYLQEVNRFYSSYAESSPTINGAGFGNDEGLILCRFNLSGCGKINSAKVYMHWSAAGNSLYAVLLDAAGLILDTSTPFTPDSTEVNDYHSFYFPNTPFLSDANYYIGIAQEANAIEAYHPVGVQWESAFVRDNAYYRADLDGGNLSTYPYPGRLMIKAEVIPGMTAPLISGSDVLCQGNTNTLQAASKSSRYANAVNAVSSEYSASKFGAIQALGSQDVYPDYSTSANSWISNTSDTQREYLELKFPGSAPANYIEIYETFNPGAIDTVYVKDDMGDFVVVYSGTAIAGPREATIMHIDFPLTSYDVTEIRLAVNSPAVLGYSAIDAVVLGQITDPDSFDTYSWMPNGETTQSIDISSPDTYVLTVTNAINCSLTDSIVVTSPTLTIPTISLSGPSIICAGDSVILTSSEAENNTWSTGELTQSITVGTSGAYNVTYNNGCESGTSTNVVVTVNPLPVVSISGGAICPGSSSILSAGNTYSSYLWSTGETTFSISVNTPGEYSVNVIDNNGCDGYGIVFAFFSPVPTPSISGDPYFCPGDSTLLDAGSGFSTYLWSTGATTQQINVASVGQISVTVTNIHGCSGSTSITTGEYTPPAPFIIGTLSLCAGSTTVLDAGAGFFDYSWSTGAFSRSIIVDTANTYTVTVTDQNGCTGTASATTTTDGAIPMIPGTITGPTEGICQGTGIVYSIDPLPNVTHFVWTVPDAVTITDGQGTTSITVDIASLDSGEITVAASNACGQSPTWNGQSLTINGLPAEPVEIIGQTGGVCGMTSVPYSIAEVYGATSYSWTVPNGASIVGGSGTNSILVSFDPSFSSGDICASASSACGTSENSCVWVSGYPSLPAEILGPDTVCRKEKNVQYSIAPVNNANSYTWTVPQQASITSGQGSTSILVKFGNKSGSITVFAGNQCGNSSLQSMTVTALHCKGNQFIAGIEDPPINNWEIEPQSMINLTAGIHPFSPEVIASAGDFSVGERANLSWTLGETIIQSIGEDRFSLSQGFQQGFYEVVAINENEEESTFIVEVFPTPARDHVTIQITSLSDSVNLMVELYDLIGTLVYKENVEVKDYQHKFELSEYSTNMFILKVIDPQRQHVESFKIIKLQ